MMKYSFIFFFLFFSFAFSQTKNEKEERIPHSEFPEAAQNYFNSFSDKLKYLKFYRETDGEKKSFEAKFKIKRLFYSVEFNPSGKLEDIEIAIKKKHIPKAVMVEISKYFEDNFKKTRFIKIQKRYVNHTDKSDKAFIQHIVEHPDDKHTHFEIIAETKTKAAHELSEFVFDRHGIFESSRKVSSSSYEHALY